MEGQARPHGSALKRQTRRHRAPQKDRVKPTSLPLRHDSLVPGSHLCLLSLPFITVGRASCAFWTCSFLLQMTQSLHQVQSGLSLLLLHLVMPEYPTEAQECRRPNLSVACMCVLGWGWGASVRSGLRQDSVNILALLIVT